MAFLKSADVWLIILVATLVSNFQSMAALLPANSVNYPPSLHSNNPEAKMNATQILQYWGYPAELYEVTTSDGYILTVHRIPHGHDEQHRNASDTPVKPVVFLQHGLLAASDCFFWNSPRESLAFLLADAGYDVWLGNFRGNKYSQQHEWLSPTSREYWEFSWDEMGAIDLPTMVSKALEVTSQQQAIYVGHSEGTTAAFVALSTNTTFATQIKLMVALAPIAYVKHIKSPNFLLLAKFSNDLDVLFNIFGYDNFLAVNAFTQPVIDTFCYGWGSMGGSLCEDTFFVLTGFDSYEYNASRTDVYMNHVPAGTSTQNVFHYAQCIESGNFQAFNYGSAQKNVEHYGTSDPPMYRPQQVTTPVALFTANNDWLSVKPDVDRLQTELPNVVYQYEVKFPYWNHIDYLLGIGARAYVNDVLIDFINDFKD